MPASMHVLISFIYVTSAPHTSDTHRYYPKLFARHAALPSLHPNNESASRLHYYT